jgi:hypothetical protein
LKNIIAAIKFCGQLKLARRPCIKPHWFDAASAQTWRLCLSRETTAMIFVETEGHYNEKSV